MLSLITLKGIIWNYALLILEGQDSIYIKNSTQINKIDNYFYL